MRGEAGEVEGGREDRGLLNGLLEAGGGAGFFRGEGGGDCDDEVNCSSERTKDRGELGGLEWASSAGNPAKIIRGKTWGEKNKFHPTVIGRVQGNLGVCYLHRSLGCPQ